MKFLDLFRRKKQDNENTDLLIDKALKHLNQEYVFVGVGKVRGWYLGIIFGLVIGASAALLFITNSTGQLEETLAAQNKLSISISADVSSGNAPLPVTLVAQATRPHNASFNFYFWWNCNSPVATAEETKIVCGDPAESSVGHVVLDVRDNYQSVPATYASAGQYHTKLIVEMSRGINRFSETGSVIISVSEPLVYEFFSEQPIKDRVVLNICNNSACNDIAYIASIPKALIPELKRFTVSVRPPFAGYLDFIYYCYLFPHSGQPAHQFVSRSDRLMPDIQQDVIFDNLSLSTNCNIDYAVLEIIPRDMGEKYTEIYGASGNIPFYTVEKLVKP